MPIYRVLRTLSRKEKMIDAGTLTRLEWLNEDGVSRLLAVGAVARIQGPPLSVLPGWKRRSEKLGLLGVASAESFLEAEPGPLAEQLEVKPETITRWQQEVMAWLLPPEMPSRR